MDNIGFISQAIRYQKTAVDQVFELMSQYQSNSDELLQNTLDQFSWLPGVSKESYLHWSASYQEGTNYLKGIVDTGFEQVEQVFTSPAPKDSTEKKTQLIGQSTTPSQKTASRKRTKPPVKKTVSKAAPSKAKASAQKTQATKVATDTASAPTAASKASTPPKAKAAKAKASTEKTQESKSLTKPASTSVSAASGVAPKATESIAKTSDPKSGSATSEGVNSPSK